MNAPETKKVARWPRGPGDMAARIRSHAWHGSVLGTTARWPFHLRTATELMLGTTLPTMILVGPEGVILYNDAFAPFLGTQHPTLLGAPLRISRPEAAARLDTLARALEDGGTLVTDDNWLGLTGQADSVPASQLSCTALRNLHGEAAGVWTQLLPHARFEPAGADRELALQSSFAAGLAAWVWSPEAGKFHLTTAASYLLGLQGQESAPLTSPHLELVHPFDQAARSAAIDESLATGEAYRCQFRIVRPCDEQVAWLEERGQTVIDPQNGHRLLSTMLWETSNQHRGTVRTEQGTGDVQRYTSALDIDTVGVAFFNADGVITEANDTYCRLHGIEKMDVLAGHVRWGDGTAREWLTLLRRSMYEYEMSGRAEPHERECVRPNSERWWGLFSAKRLNAEEGVTYVIDISSRALIEHDLKESERRLRTLMEGIPQIVWRAVEDGRWTWAGPQWTDVTGQPQSQSLGLGWLDVVHPDDRSEAHASWNRAAWNQTLEINYRLWSIHENRYRSYKTRAVPVRDASGRIREWLGTSTDVEDLQQMHGRLRMLVDELQHRTRNLLALVRAIAAQTIGHAAENSHEQYAAFSDRLAALSRAQSLVTRDTSEVADLELLLRAELAAMRSAQAAQVEVHGPSVALPASHAQILALVIHELATNAVKYGALRSAKGQLSITWTTERDDDRGRTLHLLWRESGVQITPTAEPKRGFGRELIERALQFSLDAHTDLRLGEDGVVCSIDLPLKDSFAAPSSTAPARHDG